MSILSKLSVRVAFARRFRWVPSWALAAVPLALAGCSQMGPSTIANARFDYNEAIVRSFDNQMLLNLVRLRYQDSILFLDLTSVVASYSRETTVGASTDVQLPNSISPTTVTANAAGGVTWSTRSCVSFLDELVDDVGVR